MSQSVSEPPPSLTSRSHKDREAFPLVLVISGQSQNVTRELSVGSSGAKFVISEGDGAILTGHDIDGKKWEVDFDETWGRGYYLFEADLDGNGYKDALLMTYTAANWC